MEEWGQRGEKKEGKNEGGKNWGGGGGKRGKST